MPLQLDNYDVSILNSLLKDGRKSFREISRETGITTPTVKSRFTRLVNVGFIKSVSPIFNFELIEKESTLGPELDKEQGTGTENENKKDNKLDLSWQQPDSKFKLKKGLKIKLDCEFCGGPILAEPHVFKFANYERFFCCLFIIRKKTRYTLLYRSFDRVLSAKFN
jgi:Lrp/AsnC family leucine-responsive transcriptional regulator